MKKILALMLVLALTAGFAACGTETVVSDAPSSTADAAAGSETLTGQGDGFGGPVTVTLTREDGKITDVKIVGEKETRDIGGTAIEAMPALVIAANGPDFDAIAGATVTCDAVKYAINNAIDPSAYPYPIAKAETDNTPDALTASDVYQGFGLNNMPRMGPGADDKDVPVYSFNQVMANALFDGDGKILALDVDILEVATPNYDGDGMPHFSGFPGQGGYNMDADHDEKVESTSPDTEEAYQSDIAGWLTKRERGDAYRMTTGTWASQMDAFQKLFIGKTVSEVEDWFKKYCSDLNGRPLQAGSDKPEDSSKYDALTDDEKAMLSDVVSGATMSLNDPHGDIIDAIKKAYDNRIPLDIKSAKGMGIGMNNFGRIGPGADDKDASVYSVNQIFANTIFDENDKIIAIYIDQLEYATPNYDGDGMPHFSGFPGQKELNYDSDHDGKIDSTLAPTEDTYKSEIGGWLTKRQRGDSYKMGTGTWASQMDAFQKVFIGKTPAEVEEWFKKYCSDLNGRPLQDGSDKPEDVAKYDALSDDDKKMLADVVSSATMSLNDPHGNIIDAIMKSLKNKQAIDITIG